MKRSQIRISMEDRKRILQEEVSRRKEIATASEGGEKIPAVREYLIILEALELLQAMERRGMQWSDLLKLIEESDIQNGRRPVQSNLFNP